MKLKLCGLRRPEDIEMINEVKPDYAGFIFAPTKRYVSPEYVRELCRGLDPDIKKVGVFVNESAEIIAGAAEVSGIDAVQLHGDEKIDDIYKLREYFDGEIWKGIRVRLPLDIRRAEALPVDMLLYDSFVAGEYGGTGKRANIAAITDAVPVKPFILAGGINAENLDSILSQVTPWGIDISSGFEVDGVKNKEKLSELMKTLKGRFKNE